MMSTEAPSNPQGPDDTTILGSTRTSLVFAVTVFVATVIQVLATPVSALIEGGEWPLALPMPAVLTLLVLGCAIQAAALMVSEKHPRTTVVVTVLVYLLLAIGLEVPTWLTGMYLVIALALFLLATRLSVAASVLWLFVSVVGTVGALLAWMLARDTDPSVAVWWLSAEAVRLAAPAAAATTLGIWWAGKVRRMRAARDEAEQARFEHESRVAAAQAFERSRIAQELHDVAGQHLAGLITLADAALKLAPSDPSHALNLIEDVRDEGRFAAASLAGALSDLRATSPGATTTVPDLRAADGLVDFWRTRGMDIDLRSGGDLANLPAVVSTTAYRCLQEAVTNAAKHSPGAKVLVEIRSSKTRLDVVVSNGPATSVDQLPGLGLGWGLRGILERVELLQGTLAARALPSGGWELRFEIPTVTTNS